jgi:hypothetical protein
MRVSPWITRHELFQLAAAHGGRGLREQRPGVDAQRLLRLVEA